MYFTERQPYMTMSMSVLARSPGIAVSHLDTPDTIFCVKVVFQYIYVRLNPSEHDQSALYCFLGWPLFRPAPNYPTLSALS